MSFRLKIWTKVLPEGQPEPPKYTGYELEMTAPRTVSPEQIPAELYLNAPGITAVTELSIGPGAPSELVRKKITGFAAEFAKTFEGAVEDMQPSPGADRFIYCSETFVFPAINEYTEKSCVSLWYPRKTVLKSHAREITAVFSQVLPFCLPEKYGKKEPPEFTLNGSGGIDGLNVFLETCGCVPVLYGRLPVTHVFIEDASLYAPEGSRTVPCLRVEFISAMYFEDEWGDALRRLLKALARIGADPVTGKGGAFFGQIVSGQAQVSSWWWKGIPEELGNACVIGAPYSSLIPDCAKGAALFGDTVYFEEPDGPFIDRTLLSSRKKRNPFRRYGPGEAFTEASRIPEEIFADERS